MQNAIIGPMLEQTEPLSERELEILRLVATGAANKEIARLLAISPNTVKVHLRNIFAKIGVSTRTEATLYAIQIGLIKPGTAAPEDEREEQGEAEEAAASLARSDSVVPASTTDGEGSGPGGMFPVIQPYPETRRALHPWQIALIALAALLIIGSGAVSLRMLLAPTPLPVVTAAAPDLPAARWNTRKNLPSPRKGMGIAEYENRFYLIAGETVQGVDGSTLYYEPATDRWEQRTRKPTPVTDVQAALIGEKIYVPGGRLANGRTINLLEVYDPREDTWERKASLPVSISSYALASFEGRLYLFGGISESKYLSSVFIYHPEDDHWEEGSPMDSSRAYARAVTVTGKIQVLGGTDGKTALTTHQVYFPARDADGEPAWDTLAPLPEGRYAMGAGHLAGLVYIVGGLTGDLNSSQVAEGAFQYLTQTDAWDSLETPPIPVGSGPALISSGSYLYVFGGETTTGIAETSVSYQALYTIAVPQIRRDE